MSDWEVWKSPDGREARIRTGWLEGPPSLSGPVDLRELIEGALRTMGPYDDSVTIPELDGDLVALLTDLGFEKVAYIADHDLAAAHLRAAVVQAQRSADEEFKYSEEKSKLTTKPITESSDWLQFVFTKIPLDRAIEASRNAVILAVAALEAFINQTAAQHLAIWNEEEERQSLQTKWVLLPRLLTGERTFDKGREPYQSFRSLLTLRNNLVHPKTAEKRFEGPAAGLFSSFYRPEWDAQVADGRHACVVARSMLIEFCRLVGWELPRWCAVVPPADPLDIKAWRGAVLLSGIRPDADFPNREWPPKFK